MNSTLKEIRRNANGHGVMIITFFVLVYGFSFILGLILPRDFILSPNGQDVLNLAVFSFQYLIAVPLAILMCRLTRGGGSFRLREAFCRPKVPWSTAVRWIFIGIAVTYAAAYISNILITLLKLTGIELSQPDMAANDTALSRFTNLFAMILLAPIFEEIMFRGTMYRSVQTCGIWAVLICGGTFGLWHINYAQLIYAAAMGVSACMLAAKTGSVVPGILMHMTVNTIGGIQSLFLGDFDPEKLAAMDMTYISENLLSLGVILSGSLLVMLLMGTGAILLIIELVNRRDTFRLPKPAVPAGETLRAYLTAPGILICFGILVIMTVLRAAGIL